MTRGKLPFPYPFHFFNFKTYAFILLEHFRFAYDGEWKFADLLTMSAGKLAVKFVMDTVTGTASHISVKMYCH